MGTAIPTLNRECEFRVGSGGSGVVPGVEMEDSVRP